MGLRRTALLAATALAGYSAYAWYANRRFETLEPASAGAPGAFLDLDGRSIHYVEAGQGEPVVLIHGWQGSTFSFRHTIPELARHRHAVAADMLGFGYSARPGDGDYSLTAQAELVRRVMERLGIQRAAVVGHSMGGAVAMRLALRHPERISRLVLVDAVPVAIQRRAVRLGRILAALVPLAAPIGMAREGVRLAVFRSAVHDPAHLTPEVLEGYFRPLRMKGHLRALGKQLIDRRRDDLFDPAATPHPALVLWGEQDRWLPLPWGRELAASLPEARLVVVPAAGHLPLEEQPAFCNKQLMDFLEAGVAPDVPAATPTLETAG